MIFPSEKISLSAFSDIFLTGEGEKCANLSRERGHATHKGN